MKAFAATALVTIAMTLVVACSGSSSAEAEPSATPAATTAAGTASPAATQPVDYTATPTAVADTPSPSPEPTATATESPTATVPPTKAAAPTATPVPPSPTPTQRPPQTLTVNLGAQTFSPAKITIAPGDTVAWVWGVSMVHNIKSDGPATFPGFPEFLRDEGTTLTYTFTQPGTYLYHCEAHPTTMKGTITVQ